MRDGTASGMGQRAGWDSVRDGTSTEQVSGASELEVHSKLELNMA